MNPRPVAGMTPEQLAAMKAAAGHCIRDSVTLEIDGPDVLRDLLAYVERLEGALIDVHGKNWFARWLAEEPSWPAAVLRLGRLVDRSRRPWSQSRVSRGRARQ